jgi:hypothetical protein
MTEFTDHYGVLALLAVRPLELEEEMAEVEEALQWGSFGDNEQPILNQVLFFE